jgi:hypothetical protein
MTPRDVDQMTDAELAAFERLMQREAKDAERAARQVKRGR